jgi:hypothetical protein
MVSKSPTTDPTSFIKASRKNRQMSNDLLCSGLQALTSKSINRPAEDIRVLIPPFDDSIHRLTLG